MIRPALHALAVLALAVLTQIGALAWLLALPFRRRPLAFAAAVTALYASLVLLAPLASPRERLACGADDGLTAPALYCALFRTYADPEMAALMRDLAAHMAATHPGSPTVLLDAGFPFLDAMPMLPHLSHADGEKADLALWYEGDRLPSPLGYFAFEPGPTACPDRWPTLRWDLDWLQPLWRDALLDVARTRTAVEWLLSDPRTGKVLLEPHLQDRLRLDHPKLRFQGCRAARHDDHIHVQLR